MSEQDPKPSPRPRRRRALVVLALAAVLASAVWFWGDVSSLLGRARAAPVCDPRDSHGLTGGNGGNYLLSLTDEQLDRELTLAQDAGMRYFRVDFDWSRIEAKRGVMVWSDTDRVLDAIVSHGMCPLAMVGYTPLWAADPADNPTDTHFAPMDSAAFGAFAKAAAERYRGRIAAWEVWNEPNISAFFRPAPDVEEYGRLLTAAARSIREVEPGSFIVSAGLSPAKDDGNAIAPVTFLKGLYSTGVNRVVDAVGMHPYTYPALPDAPMTSSWNAYQQMWPMREVMVAGGDNAKAIWLTEVGAPTGTDATAVDEATQSEIIRQALQCAANTPWIGPAFVYSMRDAGDDRADREQNFGIVRRDFSEKPAYGVVKQFGGAGP